MYQGLAYDIAAVMPAALDTGLFVSLCTLSAIDQTQATVDGSPVLPPAPVPGLINIQCMDAPVSPSRIQATETRDMRDIMSKGYRHVALDRYYPQIPLVGTGLGWWANIDGQDYELLGAEFDSQRTQTRLHLALVSV